MNRLAGQALAVVSEREGTTTDPVRKAMELLPLGPVMLYDTPGLSDRSALGEKRGEKTEEILRRTDIALLVMDGAAEARKIEDALEADLVARFKAHSLPFIVIINKCEEMDEKSRGALQNKVAARLNLTERDVVCFSCVRELSDMPTSLLRERIAAAGAGLIAKKRPLVADLLDKGDVVILVAPIDESAPKGRLILPQQQVIRDVIEAGAIAMTVQPGELLGALDALKAPPKLVITDSQAFFEVDRALPKEIPLTSFSILMARHKGDLPRQAAGARKIDALPAKARILISEGCTHHRQCGDIGTVKLPRWIAEKTGRKDITYEFTSGGEFPKDVSGYDLVIHCGGCTLPEKEMAWRLAVAKDAGVAMTNYGTMIAHLHGILDRATAIFGDETSRPGQ